MICANCRRPLKNPAAEVGRMKFGRICAQRLGLIEQPIHSWRTTACQ